MNTPTPSSAVKKTIDRGKVRGQGPVASEHASHRVGGGRAQRAPRCVPAPSHPWKQGRTSSAAITLAPLDKPAVAPDCSFAERGWPGLLSPGDAVARGLSCAVSNGLASTAEGDRHTEVKNTWKPQGKPPMAAPSAHECTDHPVSSCVGWHCLACPAVEPNLKSHCWASQPWHASDRRFETAGQAVPPTNSVAPAL
uniref:Uncharacterized protein n=1 Tax=Rubinisphaera brasiliensis (strain ATCC 49424 / DSM 5305 / JCM 21570 / IAM 15109 / NBRC 103401 / IFAM 1448) TaxID=756272 RepID=F0SK01_RUBBR|nr:hypothetical protein Plabr_1072 [Rubinisphaera brasiliensis DSM 5305]